MNKANLMRIAWPAFIAACALELLVFAAVDPHDLQWFGEPLGWSAKTVYSVSFFLFWAVAALSSALTALLSPSVE